jgi:hypothetical protein
LPAKELDFWNTGGGANYVKAYEVTAFEPSEPGASRFPRPDIAAACDSDAGAAAASRKRVHGYAAKNAALFTGTHLIFPAIGGVKRAGEGFAFTAR